MNMYYIRKIQRLLHGQSRLWTELFCRKGATREAGEGLQEVRHEVFVLILWFCFPGILVFVLFFENKREHTSKSERKEK